jgi:hypothetical protein
MPSFFDKVKSLVIEDDQTKAPGLQKSVAAPDAKPLKVQVVGGPTAAPADSWKTVPGSAADVPALVDVSKVEADIEAAIQAHPNFQRAVNFLKVVDSMKSVIPDEATRIRAAQAASGVDPTDLIVAVRSASLAVDSAKADFESGFVASKSADIAQSQQMAVEVQSEIDKLTQQLGDLSTQKGQIDQHVRDSSVALDKAKIDHKSVTDLVMTRYTSLADKLAKYLGAQSALQGGVNGQ